MIYGDFIRLFEADYFPITDPTLIFFVVLCIILLAPIVVDAQDNRITIPQLPTEYPRMTMGADSPEQIAATSPNCHKKVDTYVLRHVDDPEWIVSRLQMYWHSHADEIYIKSEQLDHVAGHAPVPTVR